MGLDLNDEILQDFLVEANEILDMLGEQLVELERRPADAELLNDVFRGFHTIKGGAGFLNLNALVEICHCAEDVFNTLRRGGRRVDTPLMDAVLKMLDVVNGMMTLVRAGEEPPPAEPRLLAQLAEFVKPADGGGAPEQSEAVNSSQSARQGGPAVGPETADRQPPEPAQVPGSENPAATPAREGDITEEEFEALLDKLHGAGVHKGVPKGANGKPYAVRQTVTPGDLARTDAAREGARPIEMSAQATPDMRPEGATPPRDEPAHSGDSPQQKQRQQSSAETTVRVDTRRLDEIMNLVGELVLVRNRLAIIKSTFGDDAAAKAVSNLELVTSDLQRVVMATRMQPIRRLFNRFPRVVRDISRKLNKEITLEIIGEDTELDKSLVDSLADPLVHLIRNAVDHGIEQPHLRDAAGKPRAGKIMLEARQEGDHIMLYVSDDGAGMDPEKLRSKAVEKGLMDEAGAARLDKRECFNLVLMPGFSTKSEVSDVSGRGVGMDVVKTRVAQLNGFVEIDSAPNEGTTIAIRLPLTLAIVPSLMVMLDQQIFAIPLANVAEIIHCGQIKINQLDGRRVFVNREQTLPLVDMAEHLFNSRQPRGKMQDGYVVVTRVGSRHVGCVVDRLITQEEVVIKPLGALLHGTRGLAGATITGDGRIALILDIAGLMAGYA